MLELPFLKHAIEIFRRKPVGDSADRLVGYRTPILCAFAAMIVAGKQLMGSTMTCWTPANFNEEWKKYSLDFCFIQNTYIVGWDQPDVDFDRDNYRRVNYYQWVALYFMVQAMFFYLPSFIWKSVCRRSSIRLHHIVHKSKEQKVEKMKNRMESLSAIGSSALEAIKASFSRKQRLGGMIGGPSCTLSILYVLIKVLNIAVVAFFVFHVADYLSPNFFWAGNALTRMMSGEPWTESPNFPRVTLCDMSIREIGNVRNLTLQCLLGMNFFNEKLFFVEWLWLSFVFGCLLLNLVTFSWKVFLRSSRLSQLDWWINEPARGELIPIPQLETFCTVLGVDGFLTMYLIQLYSGEGQASDMARHIYINLDEEMLSLVDRHRHYTMSTDDAEKRASVCSRNDYPNLRNFEDGKKDF